MDILNYYNCDDINYITNNVIKYVNNLEKNNSLKYLYVYGENGIGKTTIIKNILHSLKYNVNYIDCNQNQLTLEELINITDNKDVYSMFFNNVQKNLTHLCFYFRFCTSTSGTRRYYFRPSNSN